MTARRLPSRPPGVPAAAPAASPLGQRAQTALLLALLALLAARTTLGENPFRRGAMTEAGAFESLPVHLQIRLPGEVARAAAAVAVVVLVAGWATAGALAGRLEIRRAWWAVLAVVLGASLFASATRAADRREAVTAAAEQTALVASAFLAMQLAGAPWRRRLVVIVLVGLAGLQGAKGLYQVTVEIPETLAVWQAQGGVATATAPTDQSPEQRLFHARLIERTTKGFFSLANVYGSMMILLMLAAGGLALDKWRRRRSEPPMPRAGAPGSPANGAVVPTALVWTSAALTGGLCALAVWSWAWTQSKGAILAGAAALAVGAGLYAFRHWAVRHRRALTATVLGALAAGIVAVGLYGARRGGLPSRSLQVRWEYWGACPDILRQRPLLGVGPGNFADAYLPHRLAGAEEAVKNPHNVIVQALTEYGLLGGAAYLALLVGTLAALGARPAEPAQGLSDACPAGPRDGARTAMVLLAIAAGAIGWRVAMTGYPSAIVGIYDNALVALGLVPALFIAAWTDGRLAAGVRGELGPATGIAVGCGLAGFALHNLSDFALFQPGAAMVFWVAAGAMLAGKADRPRVLGRPAAAIAALALAVAAGALAVGVLAPVQRRTSAIYRAAEAYSAGRLSVADDALARAIAVDPLDGGAVSDRAGLLMRLAQRELSDERAAVLLERAAGAARLAVRRNPARAMYRRQRLELEALAREPSLLWGRWYDPPTDLPAARAEVDRLLRARPDHPSLLNTAAQYAFQAGDYDQAERLLLHARRLADWPILTDHLGDVRQARGDLSGAQAAWREFQQTRQVHLDLGHADGQDVAQAIQRLSAMDPQNARGHLTLAELAWQTGHVDLMGELLAAARAADEALPSAAVMRLTPRERLQADLLAAKAALAR